MDKKFADEMIEKYQKKFFGFALDKCSNLEEAEELALRITCEAYTTMVTVEGVYNWEGYLYRIAHNVYVNFVKEQTRNRMNENMDEELTDNRDFVSEYEKNEELELLKREVAWLGKRHREIVLLHYYHNKKIAEIARILELPEGTVKWHLSDAKTQLREGMKQMRTHGNLGIEPVRLVGLGNIGSIGEKGDTGDFLNSKLRQNIAFAAYYEPKTIDEIAKKLGVSPVFLEDEVEYLTEYGFLDLLPGHKYRTNIFISNVPQEVVVQAKELEREIAKEVCNWYVPLLLEAHGDWDRSKVYVPEDDKNYWFWSMIAQAVTNVGLIFLNLESLKKYNYCVKRKDGGEYAAMAVVAQSGDDVCYTEQDIICGPMWRGEGSRPVLAWSISSAFDSRSSGWEDNRGTDLAALHLFLGGNLPKTDAVVDKYIRLYERGFLTNREGKDSVNVIVKKETVSQELIEQEMEEIIALPEILQKKMEEKIQNKFLLEKPYYPHHMHEMLKAVIQMKQINVVMVLEELLERGILKPLTEEQKKGVMTIVYSDILPSKE